jgi:membrane fusion protein, multidrug efflux system
MRSACHARNSKSGRPLSLKNAAAAGSAWLGIVTLLLPGCGEGRTSGASPGAGAPVPVLIAPVVREDAPIHVQTIGWVEGYYTVTIKARVDGQLVGIHFSRGQYLKAGDLLFTIDPRPFEAAVRLAEATLARDKALAVDAEKDAQWKEDLFKQGSAAQREFDQSRANAESLKATVQADQASLETARLNLEYSSIRSPLTGRAGDHLVDVGNMVKTNDTALVVIDQIEPIFVTFSVPEMHLAAIQQHMKREQLVVEAVIPGDNDPGERGVLTFLDNRVDTATGTIRLKGTFQNKDHHLWPGQYVNVTLILVMERNAILVPSQAIQVGQQGQFVFVVKPDRTVDYRPVTIGRTIEHRTVVQRGVEAGEIVVTDGQLRLVPGAKVEPKQAQTENAASPPASQPRADAAINTPPPPATSGPGNTRDEGKVAPR